MDGSATSKNSPVGLSQGLLIHLRRLVRSIGVDAASICDPVVDLAAGLQDTVSGYAGLEVTMVQAGHPVTLTAVVPGTVEAAVTSLGVPLPLLARSHEAGGRAVFYSATRGAFVDLAADLCHALGPGRPASGVAPELDVALPRREPRPVSAV